MHIPNLQGSLLFTSPNPYPSLLHLPLQAISHIMVKINIPGTGPTLFLALLKHFITCIQNGVYCIKEGIPHLVFGVCVSGAIYMP